MKEQETVQGYGIAFQSTIPVRKEPSHKAEMGTQLIFGEHYTVLDKSNDGNWLYVQNTYDSYKGWIDFKQHRSISQDYYNIVDSMGWPTTKDIIGLLHCPNKVIPLTYGSIMPIYNNGVVIIDKEASKYQGEVFFPTKTSDFNFLYSVARYYLSAPYLWGGKTPFGVDCSGFVQQVYRVCGYKLPRDSYNQAETGSPVEFSDASPGDLAFFSNEIGIVTHVGIICENMHIMHASGEVRIDRLHEKGIFNADLNAYSHAFHSIRRIF